MNPRLLVGVVLAGSGGFWLWVAGCADGPPADRAPIHLGPVTGFVENRGQWPADVAFAASAAGQWVRVTARGLELGSDSMCISMAACSGGGTAATGLQPTGALCHFLRGTDAKKHVRGAAVYAAVRRSDVAPGVDLVVRHAAPGRAAAFAYDLHLARGTDAERIEFEVAGVETMHVDDATGELVLAGPRGELRQSAPEAFCHDGASTAVGCRFELRGANRFGFRTDGHAGTAGCCIDPDLRWSTCLGGSGFEIGDAVAVAANGDVFVAGSTQSTNLPVTPLAFDPSYNGFNPVPYIVGDGFVARLAAGNGGLLWCTYLGGNENDSLVAVAAIGDDAVVTGWTSSLDFPTTAGAFDTSHNGTGDGYLYSGGDAFVTRLASNGQTLVWSSLLGGAMLEYPSSLAVAPNGEVAIAGHVHSLNFPTTPGAFRSTLSGYSDFFLTRFANDGASLVGSTYCGGSDGEEYIYALAIAANGDVIAGGATSSTDLPVTPGAYDPTFNGGNEHLADGFAARLDRLATTVVWCTYLGTPANEYPRGVALNADGTMTFTGIIDGPGLPTTPAVLGPAPFGGDDGFAWRLSGDGTTSIWATYVGGSGEDWLLRPVALGGGRTAVAGKSGSPGLPLSRGSANPSPLGQDDGWLGVLSGDGSSVDYGSAFGGPFGEVGLDVARTTDGGLVTSGLVFWSGFPVTPGGLPFAGGGDAYVVRVAGLPLGVTRHGAPSGACARGARVMARSGPFVGEASFALSAGDVPPFGAALAVAGTNVLGAPLPLLGIDLWIDPGTLLGTPGVAVDSHGSAHLPLPIPAAPGLVGATLAVQFVWLDACPALSFGASDVVGIVIQP